MQKRVQDLYKQLLNSQDNIDSFNKEEILYGVEQSRFPKRDELLKNLLPFKAFYNTAAAVQKAHKTWMDGSLLDIDPETIEDEVNNFKDEIKKVADMLVAFPSPQKIAKELDEKMEGFKTNLPLIGIFCIPGMRERHWIKLSEISQIEIKIDSTSTLKKLLKLNLDPFLPKFQEVADTAAKEYSIEKGLNKMISEWETLNLDSILYRDTGTYILKSVEEIEQLLDDHIVKTQTMRSSSFSKPFEKEIKKWEEKLLYVQESLDEWLVVQTNWLYLEPIFSSEDIIMQMPEEGMRFNQVDVDWRKLMTV